VSASDYSVGSVTNQPPRVQDLRISYEQGVLNEEMLAADPLTQFTNWFNDALSAHILEPNAMVVSTVDNHGQPTSRTVLLKDISPEGFSFYTNLTSTKSRQLDANPRLSLLFPWYELHRQVIVTGSAELIPRDAVTDYYRSRPRDSQLGAWASDQSSELESRADIDARFDDVSKEFKDVDQLPVPDFWGGWLVRVERIEFWQGRESRLHDRLVFIARDADNGGTDLTNSAMWRVQRLSP
jgi:pyridoxamine 5'-phosphate oxidase